jgi:hypothetical protein
VERSFSNGYWKAIDSVLLDSILEAIGASGAIKEIKEGIKHAIFD